MSLDRKTEPAPRAYSRRTLLHAIGAALAAAPVVHLAGCSSDAATPASDGGADANDVTASNDANDAAASNDAAADAGADVARADAAGDAAGDAAVAWATGGTAAMAGGYPDPFASGIGAVCALTCSSTLGPCYATTLTRMDVSEGHPGLPVRLALLIVDDACRPIEGATVDIWHAAPEGLYSGSDASDFCTSGDATARAARWFRGVQTTNAAGRVDFNTCFPGWYSSRTVHIHFTVRVGGAEYVTGQLVFEDALDDEIIATQPLYNTRGARDTTNASDNVVSAATAPDYTFQTRRMADGAMLAWKALVVRSSLSTTLCNIGSMGGMGGDGGMPQGRDGAMPPPRDARAD